jgi:hypothetical protein
MGNCIVECFRNNGADIGWYALVAIVGCIILLIASGGLALPAFAACVGVVIGVEVIAVIFSCVGGCLV